MIIIDIGGCVGIYTDYCLEKYDNIEKIYTIEPHLANFTHLKEKYKDNDKVEVFRYAVSNFNGKAKFYKKNYDKGRGPNWVGNAGSSLKSNKTNVDRSQFEEVDVIKLSSFLVLKNIEHVDIVKIDTEGAEYDIMRDMFAEGIETFDKIFFEDHCRKVPGLDKDRRYILNIIKEKGLQSKFYEQSDHLEYAPIKL